MEEILYKVFAKLDEHNCITSVEGTAFHSEDELTEQGYVQIDEGSGNVYGHCQPLYLKEKYGKPTYDESMKPNFKYVDGKIVALTDEEKEEFYPPVEPQPSELELLKQKQELTDQALQDLILMTLGGE